MLAEVLIDDALGGAEHLKRVGVRAVLALLVGPPRSEFPAGCLNLENVRIQSARIGPAAGAATQIPSSTILMPSIGPPTTASYCCKWTEAKCGESPAALHNLGRAVRRTERLVQLS